MRSRLPKVLQPLAGTPLIGHILQTLDTLEEHEHAFIVTGHLADSVENYCLSCRTTYPISFIKQTEQLGTGHAVQQVLPSLPDQGISIVLYGDVPLIGKDTIKRLLDQTAENSIGLLTQSLANPTGYGRIIREKGKIHAIVEEKDATDAEKAITEVNTGILAVSNAWLNKLLPKITNNNQQREYYLTDLIGLAVAQGIEVTGVSVSNALEAQGVNSRPQLAELERAFQGDQANRLMSEGVTLLDPARFDCRGCLTVGKDVVIDVNCVFKGKVVLADGVTIGANCIIGEAGKTVTIGEDVEIKSHSIIESGEIDAHCVIGPFARIRPDTRLKAHVKIGNFVEVKKSDIEEGAKVNHLTYIGDASIGKAANIGAGTITCNYDGVNKSKTVIGDHAFIGSNSALVAPVEIDSGSTVAAGSTITRNVGANQLAIARGKQRNIDDWPKPEKK